MRAPSLAILTLALIATAARAAPTVQMPEPLDDTVARPSLHVRVTCDDHGGPCARIEVSQGGQILASDDESTVLERDLVPAQSGYLDATGTDHAQQSTKVSRYFLVDTSPRLYISGVVDAWVRDADLGRILYIANGEAYILHRDDCSVDDLGPAPDANFARLTGHGALFGTHCDPSVCDLFEWRDGQRIHYGVGDSPSVKIAGEYFTWTTGRLGAPGPLYRVDMSTGLQTLVTSTFTATLDAVADDGSVFYTTDDAVTGAETHRWSGGTDTVLGSGEVEATDGTLTVVATYTGAPTTCKLSLFDNSGLVEVLRADACPQAPFYDTKVHDGWVAYPLPDGNGILHQWVRDPAGTKTDLGVVAGTSMFLEALGLDGEVMMFGDGSELASPTKVADSFSTAWFSRPRFDRGHWVVWIGRDVFGIDEELPCPSGPCTTICAPPPPPIDAGVPDASPSFDAARSTDAMPNDAPTAAQDSGGGCGCGTSDDAAPPFALIALVCALLIARRRRPR